MPSPTTLPLNQHSGTLNNPHTVCKEYGGDTQRRGWRSGKISAFQP